MRPPEVAPSQFNRASRSASARQVRMQPLLLPTVSIVEQTMGVARRLLVGALLGAALIIGVLLVERLWYSAASEAAAERQVAAEQVAGALRLADQKLTAAAQMAVATGERRWVDAYDTHRPERDRAIKQAQSIAPAGAAERFDAQTRAAKEELDNLRESAFEAVTVGASSVARTIFDGDRYRQHTLLLTTATAELATATVVAARAEVAALIRRAILVGTLVLLGALLLGAALLRGLNSRFERSRSVFVNAEDRIQRLASSDVLTGLANRAALHDSMATAMARAEREGHRVALLMIDLDRFKPINDRHGHMIGDLVLKEVAHRLSVCLRSDELRARYGGDESVVAIEEKKDSAAPHAVAERILQALSQPMLIDNLSVAIGASIGISRFPDDATGGDELLRKADSALYRAKAQGRGGYCFYDVTLDEQVAERYALEQAMRSGIALGQFVPYYQPIVDLDTRSVQSLELLCRWNHPQRGLLPPSQFIPLAEESGLIGAMTLSTLHEACIDLPRFPAHWSISINVAPNKFGTKRWCRSCWPC